MKPVLSLLGGSTDVDTASVFACDCDAKGRKEIAAVMAWAKEFLRTPKEEFFLTNLVHALASYSAGIESIYADQWCGISVDTYPNGSRKDDPLHVWVQCDRIEDGLAYALRVLYEKYGPLD